MDGKRITTVLENLIDPARCEFAGVFPRDQIPNHHVQAERYPYCFVANSDTASRPGEHWVAFYYPTPNDCEFFDSYGLHPIYDYRFPISTDDDLLISPNSLQSFNSNVCGHFVIYFLAKRSLNHSFKSIIDTFMKGSPEWNDNLVRQFVRRRSHIRTYLPYIVHFHRSLCRFNQTCCSRRS